MTVSTAPVENAPEPSGDGDGQPQDALEPLRLTSPTLDDPVVNLGADGFGGVLGRRARGPLSRGAVAFILLLLTLVSTAVGIGMREPCFSSAWTGGGNQQYTHMCYSDIPFMYQGRGFADGQTAYYSTNQSYFLEYPVLTGAAMETAALLARHVPGDANNQGRWFYVFTTWFLLAFAAITVIALVGLAGPRPWDAAMFAVAPGLILTGTINWDLIAVGLAAVALFCWARRRPAMAGVFIGLGTAAKLYPALLLVALLLLCWRAGKMKQWGLCLLAAVGSWLVVNLPFMIENYQSWLYFYKFNETRGADWGSLWLFLEYSPLKLNLSANAISVLFGILLLLSCVSVGLLTWLARARPRVGQIAFLVAAAFILFNKVYSPQYVLWLIPLAVLARPRWRDFLIWQACEFVYYCAIWMYLVTVSGASSRGLPELGYDVAIGVHIAGTVFFVVQVVRDVLDTRRDPVRNDGYDDPAGGVLDEAPDVYGFSDRGFFTAAGHDAADDELEPGQDAEAEAESESEAQTEIELGQAGQSDPEDADGAAESGDTDENAEDSEDSEDTGRPAGSTTNGRGADSSSADGTHADRQGASAKE